MTPRQSALYWREWANVREICPAADRHDLHAAALGVDKSSKRFTNADLDKVLAEFRAVSDPANLDAQLARHDQPKRRLIWRCRQLAPEAYVARVCRDRFATEDLTLLDVGQLTQLRNTLKARANKNKFGEQPEKIEPKNA